MFTLKRFTLILIIAMLTACSAAPKTPLAANREKWDAQHITHYRFDLAVSCFCAFRDRMPLTIEVKDGKVVSMVDSQGQPVTEFGDTFDSYNTIDKLFAKLDAALNGGADKTTVEYDPEKGYPQSIFIDYIEKAMDDEIGFTVTNLTVVE